MAPSGTYRESDGSAVPFAQAQAEWAKIARRSLERVAGVYHGTISYSELAEEVQAISGIRTTKLMWYWIGAVLEEVALMRRPGEPLLTSLCVRADGTIGDGYAKAVVHGEGSPPDDLEVHAAHERLLCYRAFGATLPPGGGTPALTPQVAARRERDAKKSPPPPVLCPRCFVALPATGQCDSCA